MEYITPVGDILQELNTCIIKKESFSLIRFGDGGLKFMRAILEKDIYDLKIISDKEGLPKDKLMDIFYAWGKYANEANYIDCPDVYFNETFWPRMKKVNKQISHSTKILMLNWQYYYSRTSIENTKYCNPEINFLSLLRTSKNSFSLLDLMKNKKICIITPVVGLGNILKKNGYNNVRIIKIVKQYEDHYYRCFHKIIDIIKRDSSKYDLWLISAGELGRIYTGVIKECGGRSFDLGFVSEFWRGAKLHPRLQPYIHRNMANRLMLELSREGLKYDEFI